jgi:hypothetical protein
MKHARIVASLMLFAALAAPRIAAGQTEDGGPMAVHRDLSPAVEVTPFVGFGSDLAWMHNGLWWDDNSAHRAGMGPALGARIGVRISGPLFVEGAAGFSNPMGLNSFWGYGHPGGYGGAPGPSATSFTYDANIRYEFRQSDWAPFITAGGGAITTFGESGNSWTDPAANFGAGVKYYVMPNISIRMDLRAYMGRFHQIDPLGVVHASGVTAYPQVTAGVGFGF